MSLFKLLTCQKALVALLNQATAVLPDVWWLEDVSGQVIFGTAVPQPA